MAPTENNYIRELEAAKGFESDDDEMFYPLRCPAQDASRPSPVLERAIEDLRLSDTTQKLELLSLPRELRDMIWEHILVEPDLFDRRHRPGCPFHCTTAISQVPPAIVVEKWEQETTCRCCFCHHEQCKSHCIRRQGLAVLRTCKQVYTEGSKIFWKHNNFCFFDGVKMLQVLDALTPVALANVRSLSLRELCKTDQAYYTDPRPLLNYGKRLFEKLTAFSALRYFECPALWARYVSGLYFHELFALTNFEQFVLSVVQEAPKTLFDGQRTLHMSLSAAWSTLEAAPCARGACPGGPRPSQRIYDWCGPCGRVRKDIQEVATILIGYQGYLDNRHRSTPMQFEQAWTQVRALKPTHSNGPLTTDVVICGERRQATIWGLPNRLPRDVKSLRRVR